MPEWIDSPAEALTILSIAGVLFAALMWLIRAQIMAMRELKPNHGSSMRDAIDRIERSQREMLADIRELRTQHGEINGPNSNITGSLFQYGRFGGGVHFNWGYAAGPANTGQGGGGGANTGAWGPGPGGSGVVIVAYQIG